MGGVLKDNKDGRAAEGMIGSLFRDPASRDRALRTEPGLHNVLGIEAAFEEAPLEVDYIDPASPYHTIKALSTSIYRELVTPWLDALDPGARVLDAGCGIGRFTLMLAERFDGVVAFDPSPSSLDACSRHLDDGGFDGVALHWGDLTLLDDWPAGSFDAVLAAELICYTADPARALERLCRVLRPGGRIFLSVEGRPGALVLQDHDDPLALVEALRGSPMVREADRFVHCFEEGELESMLKRAGLRDVEVRGSHYFGEGPFWHSIDDSRLTDRAYVDRILRAERTCRTDPAIAPWARVFTAAGKKG